MPPKEFTQELTNPRGEVTIRPGEFNYSKEDANMRIQHISVSHFRGIESLDWLVDDAVCCLIGPGDSTKSTLLDAIELCLSPRWNVAIADCDFHMADTSKPIEIKVTVTGIPDTLRKEEKFGLYLRGWDSKKKLIHDEPEEEDALALTIRFRVDDSLDPEWSVVNDRDDEGRRISSRDRSRICITRLDTYPERHLSWRQGSALLHLTSGDDDVDATFAGISRRARQAAKLTDTSDFQAAVDTMKTEAAKIGVAARTGYIPALDERAINIGTGSVSVHDGAVPVRQAGMGSRRLVALAAQMACVEQGAILLIDEVEHGLEPYRLRRFIQHLSSVTDGRNGEVGQVFATSHSAITTVELPSEHIYVARSDGGHTQVTSVGASLQSLARAVPEALLGLKVIMCEGKTEYGILSSLEGYWLEHSVEQQPRLHFACLGVIPVDGGGDCAPQRALDLAKLRYGVCLFIDSDKLDTLKPDVPTLRSEGVHVIHWAGACATEQRIALDLPWGALQKLLALAVDAQDKDTEDAERSVFDAVRNRLPVGRPPAGNDIDVWTQNGLSQQQVRDAIGEAAKTKKWFKTIRYGKELGSLIVEQLDNIPDTDLASKLNQIGSWVYA